MKTKEFEIFTIDEIEDEKQKQKIIDEWRSGMIECRFDMFYDYMMDYLNEKYDLQNIALFQSLSYCQGDGARFECDDLLQSHYMMERVQEILTKTQKAILTKLIKNNNLIFRCVHGGDHHYEHCTKYDVVCELNYDEYYDGYYGTTKKQRETIEATQFVLTNEYLRICNEIEDIGYQNYDISDEDVIEDIKDCECEFICIYGNYERI